MQNQNMNLVLSTDAKPRLKWTPELHQRFVEAVSQLGGADSWGKANSPKTALTVSKKDGDVHFNAEINERTENQINDSLQIAQALQLQMEVQRKLHEQIEVRPKHIPLQAVKSLVKVPLYDNKATIFQVQRHLQLRIEAQGKYLQSVLKKAQETLAGYNSSSMGVELAKAELSQLVSMVNSGLPSSSHSELTDRRGSSLKNLERKQMRGTICSMESSLTSSESSGRKEEDQPMDQNGEPHKSNMASVELQLIEVHPEYKPWNNVPSNQASGRKRSGSTISDGICVEQPVPKRSPNHRDKNTNHMRKSGFLETLDLNSQYQNDIDSGPKAIDLNCKGV
ncbi:hypothetical protein FEM48_Zijuj10G0083800 [Ziziphus jujuba var. spinosa]|uniref:MYB-CC type transcription factor LHEQLE-containing domain-containing protein n=1 Tax=Ziziphus jujuba var. spinosa TaxID=714518 RepID=A0A978UMA9_ZIZJJ|nr:hypothetical protein FEM48_Zijuj10G0083800 [Ziziphus jujuba var. spinosa]